MWFILRVLRDVFFHCMWSIFFLLTTVSFILLVSLIRSLIVDTHTKTHNMPKHTHTQTHPRSHKNALTLPHKCTNAYRHTHTPLPPFLLTSLSFILDHYRRRGRERENERKQKRERGGKGVSVYKALPPSLHSSPHLVCQSPFTAHQNTGQLNPPYPTEMYSIYLHF